MLAVKFNGGTLAIEHCPPLYEVENKSTSQAGSNKLTCACACLHQHKDSRTDGRIPWRRGALGLFLKPLQRTMKSSSNLYSPMLEDVPRLLND